MGTVLVTMTLTTPNCPAAGFLPGQVEARVRHHDSDIGPRVAAPVNRGGSHDLRDVDRHTQTELVGPSGRDGPLDRCEVDRVMLNVGTLDQLVEAGALRELPRCAVTRAVRSSTAKEATIWAKTIPRTMTLPAIATRRLRFRLGVGARAWTGTTASAGTLGPPRSR